MKRCNIIAIGLMSLLPLTAAATTTHLHYDAFVGQTKVAQAEFQIRRAGEEFEIEGEARSVGVVSFLTRWRSLFAAAGRFVLGRPVAEQYEVIQQNRKKEKRIELRDGIVRYQRNGEERAPRPQLDGTYMLSALFLSNDCESVGNTIHDGKDRMQLELISKRSIEQPAEDGVVLQCEFNIVDEDNDSTRAIVRLIAREGLTIPLEMELSGAVEGKLQLAL